MEYITLKNSDLRVSRLCMGGCPLGGHGWGNIQDENLINAVQEAFENGINFFDTADTYGLGKSEELLGKSLEGKREKVVIASKFGVRVENGKTFYDNSPQWIQTAVESSLRSLKTDYIDLYQIHYRDGKTPLSVVVDKLEELKKKGYVRYFGLSNIHEKDIEELQEFKGVFASFQDEYSLACRKNEEDINYFAENIGLTPCTWGSLGQGILTGKYDKNTAFQTNDRRSRDIYVNFHGKKLLKNLEIVEVMKKISNDVGRPLSAIAIRFILDYLPQSVVLAGAKNAYQVRANSEAFGWKLTQEQLNMLDKISK